MPRRSFVADRAPFVALLALGALPIAAPLGAQTTTTYRQLWSIEAEESEFVAPASMAVTKSCQVWIADPQSGLWRFGCDDPQPVSVGRVGGGPGEFRSIMHVTTVGDGGRVLLWDRSLQRASIFTEVGKFDHLQTLRLPEGAFGTVLDLTLGANDSVALVWTNRQPRMGNDVTRRSFVYSMGHDGAVLDSLATLEGFGSIRFQASMGKGAMLDSRFDAPLQRRPFVVFLPDGGFVTGTNDGPRLTRYDARGRAVRTIPLPLPRPSRVTSNDRAAYMDSIRRSATNELKGTRATPEFSTAFWKAFESNIERAVEYPDTRQWFDELILDDTAQHLWVQLPRHDENYSRTWLEVRLADGTTRRSITIPHRGAVVAAAVGGDSLIAIERSREAFPRVARYGAGR
jgi:hypothetical protein